MDASKLTFVAGLVALALAASCGGGSSNEVRPGNSPDAGGAGGGGGGGGGSGELPPSPKTDWTIFVYGHGDHNLGPSLVQDMLEMADANLGGKVNVVVVADWNGSQKPFPTGTEWYRIEGGGAKPKLIATGPELNFDEPNVLAATIAAAFKANPANHHGVVIWDHGGAWKLGFGSDTQDGTMPHPRGMDVIEAAAAVRAGLDAA